VNLDKFDDYLLVS